jgi:hypothetical protein
LGAELVGLVVVYKVFISHAFSHHDLYANIEGRLNKQPFDWRDCSVPKHRRFGDKASDITDIELKKKIGEAIDNCDVFIAIAKPVATTRPWLVWEVEYAKSKGKPVIAYWRKGKDFRTSMLVRAAADVCISSGRINDVISAIVALAVAARKRPPPVANQAGSFAAWVELMEGKQLDNTVKQITKVQLNLPAKTRLRRIPRLGSKALSQLPDFIPATQPLAPIDELALAPGEQIVPESPKEVLLASWNLPLFPVMEAIPIAKMVAPVMVMPSDERPQGVLASAINRRRYWWQFWKQADGTGASKH